MRGLGTILFLVIFLLLSGCGGEAPRPTKVPIAPAAKKPPTPAKTPPALALVARVEPPPMVMYSYNPKGKINPFKPLVVERPAAPKKSFVAEIVSEGATPLERIDLRQVKLVALIWNVHNPRAMVEDAGGKGYIIAKGTPIGKSKGIVTQITSAGVMIKEKYETPAGKVGTRNVTIKLYPD